MRTDQGWINELQSVQKVKFCLRLIGQQGLGFFYFWYYQLDNPNEELQLVFLPIMEYAQRIIQFFLASY